MDVVACPKCYHKVNPSLEYALTGAGDYYGVINCAECGYKGLPIQVTEKEYEKLVKSKK